MGVPPGSRTSLAARPAVHKTVPQTRAIWVDFRALRHPRMKLIVRHIPGSFSAGFNRAPISAEGGNALVR